MNKNTKLIIKLAGVLLLASLILIIIILISKGEKTDTLESKFKETAIQYYEEIYKPLYPEWLAQFNTLQVDLDGLKGARMDVEEFEKHKCDMNDTYAIFTYQKDSSYDITVHLSCEE